jgi:hypothetical protein
MPIGALLLLLAAALTSACGGLDFFRQYEYEEDVYLSLDGSATVYVNSSIPALNALRGASFDTNPGVPVDRDAVRRFFATPRTRVTRVAVSRRASRRFVHVRLNVDDVRQMGGTAPFSWSSYRFSKEGDLFVYRQNIGSSAAKSAGDVGWTGDEVVAFRLHLPSRIVYHNAGPDNLKRGNILVWEQRLDARARGEALTLDARMEAQSILYRTLILFGGTVGAVGVGFFVLLWWIMRRGRRVVLRASGPEGASASDPTREASVR